MKLQIYQEKRKQLVEELFRNSSEGTRCPYIQRDENGEPYCSKDLKQDQPISDERKIICDHFSLQIWCLTKDQYNKCIFYRDEPIG